MAEDRLRRIRSFKLRNARKRGRGSGAQRKLLRRTGETRRVIYRHMKESSGQRLALEAGDIDVARNLETGRLRGCRQKCRSGDGERAERHGLLHQPQPARTKRWQTRGTAGFKYLVDYDADRLDADQGHRRDTPELPAEGVLVLSTRTPTRSTLPRRRNCWRRRVTPTLHGYDGRAQHPAGDWHCRIFPADAGRGGVKLESFPGDGKQTLTQVRARNHDMYIGQWGMDYFDPHSMPIPSPTIRTIPTKARTRRSLAQRWDVPATQQE